MKADEKRGLRNYFLQRSKSATNAHALLSALRGLQVLSDVPNIDLEGESRVALGGKTQTVTFNLLDNFGKPFVGIQNLKVSLE